MIIHTFGAILKLQMIQQQKKSVNVFGSYTCSSYSESNSGNIGGSSINKSKSMSLTQRSLLTPAEILRINRPYLLVMYSGKNPAMTKAPDLSKWNFNRMLSLGDQEFCTKVRTIRETARYEAASAEITLWDIDNKMQDEMERQKSELEAERNNERIRRLEIMREMKYAHREPMIGLDRDRIYENIEKNSVIEIKDAEDDDDDETSE